MIFLKKIRSALIYLGIRGIFKSIYFNFRYLPIKDAIKLPVFLSRDVEIRHCSGKIKFTRGGVGCLLIGFSDLEYTFHKKSMINIQGSLVINGAGPHFFAPGTILYVGKNAVLEIGENFSCSHDCKFYIRKSLKIGNDNMYSYYNVIMDTDAHPIFDSSGKLLNENKGVVIGNKVWMGCRCTVLKGANIANNTIIASNSVVTQQTPSKEGSIITSKKILRENISWERTLL